MSRLLPSILLLAATLPVSAQNSIPPNMADNALLTPLVADPIQGGWSYTEQSQAALQWQARALEMPSNVEAQYNRFRATRNASLAQYEGNLPSTETTKLQQLADDLEETAPNSFEAHLANFQVAFPTPVAFLELDKAEKIAAQRSELVAPKLAQALKTGDVPAQRKWATALKNGGQVSPALLDVARDMLLSTDPNAVLITAGEMDTYPVLAVQHGSAMRTDVLVVDRRMLSEPEYRSQVWRSAGASGAVPGNGPAFVRGLAASGPRPVALALTLPADWHTALREQLYATGMVFRYSAVPFNDIPLLEAHWKAMKKNTAAGPVARNYLYCGAVLLEHYRQQDNEMAVVMLEDELRQMALKLGCLPDLYKAGVLKH